MRLGFTGTQRGMTTAQREAFAGLVAREAPTEFHHGDCVGADEEAWAIVVQSCTTCETHAWQGNLPSKVAHTKSHVLHGPYNNFHRNGIIATVAQHLVACPGEATEQLRSGTWSTVRRARKLNRRITIIFPNGTITEEGNG